MKNSVAAIALAGVIFCSAAVAQDIYRWTDENGNVNYGDRPSGKDVETLALSTQPTDPDAVQDRIDARLERQEERALARTARQEARRKEAEERQAAERQAERCSAYRARLEKFITSRRLYRTAADGERVYLDERQKQEARADLQARIEETCSG